MAVGASLACNPTTVTAGPNGKITATVTVTNDLAVAVRVTGLQPYLVENGKTVRNVSGRVGVPALLGRESVAATSGSNAYSFDVVFDAPLMGDAAETVDVGCLVFTDVGVAAIIPTLVSITVNPRT